MLTEESTTKKCKKVDENSLKRMTSGIKMPRFLICDNLFETTILSKLHLTRF